MQTITENASMEQVMNYPLPNRSEVRSDEQIKGLQDFVQEISFTGPRGYEDHFAKYLDKWLIHGPVTIQAPSAGCYHQSNGIPVPCGHNHILFKQGALPNFETFKWFVGMAISALILFSESVLPQRQAFHLHGVVYAGIPPYPTADQEFIRIKDRQQGYDYSHRIFNHISQLFAACSALRAIAPELCKDRIDFIWIRDNEGRLLRPAVSVTGHIRYKEEKFLVQLLRQHHARLCATSDELAMHWAATSDWYEIGVYQHLFSQRQRQLINNICREQGTAPKFFLENSESVWHETLPIEGIGFHYLRYRSLQDYYSAINTSESPEASSPSSPQDSQQNNETSHSASSQEHSQIVDDDSDTGSTESLLSGTTDNSTTITKARKFLEELADHVINETSSRVLADPEASAALRVSTKARQRQRGRSSARSKYLPLLEAENAKKVANLKARLQATRDRRTGLSFKEWAAKHIQGEGAPGPTPVFEAMGPNYHLQRADAEYRPSSPSGKENVSDSDYIHASDDDTHPDHENLDSDWN